MYNTSQIETHITLCNMDITIRQESVGTPSTKWGAMRYCHPVTIIVPDKWRQTFDYYRSERDYAERKDMLSETGLMDALECIISDSIAGTYDCKEFFAEFGYEDPCEGIKAWQACVKMFEMLNVMGISEDMLYDMINELEDITSRSD